MQEQWEKINAMKAGPELDELIARAVMDMDCICMGDYWGNCPRHSAGGKAPLFSTDMGKAWRVVEKMREKGNVVSIYVMESYRGVSVMIEDACHGPQYRMVAPTAAEAICKAALFAEFPH